MSFSSHFQKTRFYYISFFFVRLSGSLNALSFSARFSICMNSFRLMFQSLRSNCEETTCANAFAFNEKLVMYTMYLLVMNVETEFGLRKTKEMKKIYMTKKIKCLNQITEGRILVLLYRYAYM